ncbi:gliding motility protein GldM [Flavobacterium psychrophilum]|uniref:type IX secretion system motor protein PorM/GldM n=1 Tax=Flavobacterium psychrophilum TaxID=96345 RepID=UPI000B7C391D|nr:gliding motility protein GldM [Flavobacterium psychrophilum]MEB3396037.1 gliding motility protein GldM [Flavobacterium psychrophilum]QRE51242.1 gliding motility protein GldM [Flavobacterium psychrophilum]SNA70140.1 Gliding motility transmembrane protein GldM [Flavobacterium psychrophilum]
MAGGKLTPRQKMINLMYLVFIAMLAMNMSKEVLSAFGLMNEKFEGANTSSDAMNAQMLTSLDSKAAEAKGEFLVASQTAHRVEGITKKFYDYIATLKGIVLEGVEKDKETGKLPYEAMDKGDNIDNAWFVGEGYSPKGKEIVATIEKYKADMKAACPDKKYANIISEIANKFDLSDVANKDGVKIKYLEYHFDKFPAVASLAKLSAWQSDVKKAESDVYSAALGKAAVAAASYSNYQAIVVLEKNAYFQGETVKGKVVLGRYDENTKPTSFQGPGRLENGQAVISLTAGSVGEQKINGQFTFLEDGKTIPLKFAGNYVVVPRPNSATISADKMNVVYRGVPNPMTISFAGVANNKVHASAAGMSGSDGKYVLRAGAGTSVMINVTATLPDGKAVSDKKEFRIKGLPAPTGKIRGEVAAKGQKSNLESCTVSAVMEDFDFPVTVNVTQFNIKVPGQPTIVVSGSKMDSRARSAIAKATRGDVVVISEIKASFSGIDQVAKRVSTCTYEVQ